MSEQNDDNQNYALMVLAGVILLVVGGVLALAAYRGLGGASRPDDVVTTSAVTAIAGRPDGRIYFEFNSDVVPPEGAEVLTKLAEAARLQPAKVVLISGFHDATGDAAANAELAKKRAQAVQKALEADGVEPARLLLDKPNVTTGNGDDREARRVELRLR